MLDPLIADNLENEIETADNVILLANLPHFQQDAAPPHCTPLRQWLKATFPDR